MTSSVIFISLKSKKYNLPLSLHNHDKSCKHMQLKQSTVKQDMFANNESTSEAVFQNMQKYSTNATFLSKLFT